MSSKPSSPSPDINITLYTSPGCQTSVPATPEPPKPEVTVPWLLSPKWYSTTRLPGEIAGRRLKMAPQDALAEIRDWYYYYLGEFHYPWLTFKDGEPVLDQGYVAVLSFIKQLEGLVEELGMLRILKENESQREQLVAEMRESIERVKTWVEEERARAIKTEVTEPEVTEEKSEEPAAGPGSSLCIIA